MNWSKEVFARNLRYYMESRGKNQRELADIAGVSAPTVNDWLKGKKYPRIDKIERLADYFGIYKSDLIEDKRGQDIVDPETAAKNARIAALTQRMRTSETLVEVVNLLSAMDDSTLDSIRDYVSFLKNKK